MLCLPAKWGCPTGESQRYAPYILTGFISIILRKNKGKQAITYRPIYPLSLDLCRALTSVAYYDFGALSTVLVSILKFDTEFFIFHVR